MPRPRQALGTGVNGLFRGPASQQLPSPTPAPVSATERTLFVCPIVQIAPQEGQPRRHIDAEKLAELAASIKAQGLIEPLVVRRVVGVNDSYTLIAGERRWRACQIAGLDEVPVVVKEVSDLQAFELALLENIQREDLNPIELAEAYHRLIEEYEYTHESIANLVRKNRATVTNTLRLLKLPPRVRDLVVGGKLTEGHARALMGLDSEEQIEKAAEIAIIEEFSVRQTEALVQNLKAPPAPEPAAEPEKAKEPRPKEVKPPNIKDLEENLTRDLGTKVLIKDRKNKGQIVIAYDNLDALDRLLLRLRG